MSAEASTAAGESRVAVITGASSGIGRAAAKQLAELGWSVIGVGRDAARCAEAEAEIRAVAAPDAEVVVLRGDLSLMAEADRIAAEITARVTRIDALLNNAGGVVAERSITAEGNEETFAGNHLAPFLLTERLLPLLRSTVDQAGRGAVRIVGVSSIAHEHFPAMNWDDLTFSDGYVGGSVYCHAKLANMLFTHELAKRVGDDGILAVVMHPGLVNSNFASHCPPDMQAYLEAAAPTGDTPELAAETLVWLATADEAELMNGGYFHKKAAVPAAPHATDDQAALRLWNLSEQLVSAR